MLETIHPVLVLVMVIWLSATLILGYVEQRRLTRPKSWIDMTPQEKLANYLTASKAVREAEIPGDSKPWQRMMADPQIHIFEAGGSCPVQIELEVDDQSAYFRARGTHWSFQVAKPEYFAPCRDNEQAFKLERYYGEWPSAGYMSMSEAAAFLEEAIQEFRGTNLAARGTTAAAYKPH